MGHAKRKEEWIVIDRLADIVLSNAKSCIVDIGIGLSTVVLAEHAKKFQVKQYSCDRSKKIIDYFGCPLHDLHYIYCKESLEFLKEFNDIPSLVFLDGIHNYEVVRREVDFFLNRLAIGGILFIHDTYPPYEKLIQPGRCHDAYRVRQELEKNHSLWTFTWPYTAQSCGLTMVMKKEENRPFYRR